MTNTDNNSSFKIEKSTAEITTIDQLPPAPCTLPTALRSTPYDVHSLSPPPVVPVFFHHEGTKNTKGEEILCIFCSLLTLLTLLTSLTYFHSNEIGYYAVYVLD